VAVIFAATIGIVLRLNLTAEQMTDWGWRVPFVIGSLLIPFLLIMRRSIEETEEFKARRRHPISPRSGAPCGSIGGCRHGDDDDHAHCRDVLSDHRLYGRFWQRGPASVAGRQLSRHHLHRSRQSCVDPDHGLAVDRIGRAPILMAAAATIAVVSYPCMEWLVAEPSLTRLLMVEMFLGSLYGMWQGVLIISIVEIMPAEVRAAGWSVAYSLTYAIFGGFTPALVTWLIHETGDKGMPGAALVPAAVIGLIGTILARKHLSAARHSGAAIPSLGD